MYMQYEERYSMNALSKKTGYSNKLLRKWREKEWLIPISSTGSQMRFTLTGLKKAESKSIAERTLKEAKKSDKINWSTAF